MHVSPLVVVLCMFLLWMARHAITSTANHGMHISCCRHDMHVSPLVFMPCSTVLGVLCMFLLWMARHDMTSTFNHVLHISS
jgi:hypothetical protein